MGSGKLDDLIHNVERLVILGSFSQQSGVYDYYKCARLPCTVQRRLDLVIVFNVFFDEALDLRRPGARCVCFG